MALQPYNPKDTPSTLHFLQNWHDHVESRSLAGILVHANLDQLGQVRRYSGLQSHPQSLQRNLHTDFHGTLIGEGHFASGEFPQQNGEAPHVGGLPVAVGNLLLQCFGGHPARIVDPALFLEGELCVRHVDASGQVVVDHDVAAVQVVFGDDALQAVEEGHSSRYIKGEADCLGVVDDDVAAFVEHTVQRADAHVLVYNDQVWRRVAAADYRQYVRMGEDAEFGEFLIEIPGDSRCAVADGQDFSDDVILLPDTSVSRAARCLRNLFPQSQVFDVDSLETGQSRISRSCFKPQPAVILKANFLQILSRLYCQIMQHFR